MNIADYTIGIGFTGSFCTFDKILKEIAVLKEKGVKMLPVFSYNAAGMDNRFMEAAEFRKKVEELTEKEGYDTIPGVEPLGPKGMMDVMVIAPCTGNTLAKLCNGITDTPVLMAAKGHLRNGKPLVIAVSTNDALGINFKNIGMLMAMKNIYFVPFGQDDCVKKPNSMIARLDRLEDTVLAALEGKQIQPVITA